MSLDKLRIAPGKGPCPTAEQHNGLLAYMLRNRFKIGLGRTGGVPTFPHPWKVTVDRFTASSSATLDPSTTWRIDVAPGCNNDLLATIPYLRTGDPRGWVMPADYVAPLPGERGYDATYIERDPLDDFDDPPFLVVRDPATSSLTSGAAEWKQVTDDERPREQGGAFCGADDWPRELWRAHVILAAVPLRTPSLSRGSAQLPPPALRRFRLYTSATKPSATFAAAAGGALELATLYLLRNPDQPESAEVRVRMQEWYPLWSAIVQPGQDQIPLAEQIGGQEFFDLAGFLENTLEETAHVDWWNV